MKSNFLMRVVRKNEFISIALSLVLILILSISGNGFWAVGNLDALQASVAPRAIMCFGMMLLLICGYFDLSISSTMLLAGILSGRLCLSGVPVPITILLVLLMGAVMGAINGWLVSVVGINALITTIGTQYIGYGVAMTIWNGMKSFTQSTKLPDSFIALGETKFLGLYIMSWVALVLLALFWFFLKCRPTGRSLYFVGGNKEAAQQMGIGSKKIVFGTYMLSGFLAALAGVLSVARIQSPTQYMGEGIHMTCMIACVIGGGSFAGGKGTALGALVGALFMSLLTNMFSLLQMKLQLQNVVVGLILVAVVAIDGYISLKKMREMGKA